MTDLLQQAISYWPDFAALALFAIASFSLSRIYSRFVRVLRDDHHSVWERIGKPESSFSSNMTRIPATYRLVRSSDVATIDDQRLRKWQKRTRYAMYVHIFSLVIFLVMWAITMGGGFDRR